MLADASRFVIDLQKLEMSVLFDACILDTCCVTNEHKKVTYFVMNADNLTLLRREEDVEANVRLQRQFNTFSFMRRTIDVYSYLERCPSLSNVLLPFFDEWTSGVIFRNFF